PVSSAAPAENDKGKGITILEGMLPVYGLPVRVLFDTGASRSFISSDMVCRLGLEPEIVCDFLVVYNLVGGSANLSTICLGVE
ncbi:aspartyl protease family protein, partial [Pseudomonas aeruginosa]|uniref:aspartyl protease family protein n=1 Tax=Pseudomonas aeruginosa TaxID=287 RepID=UPI0027D3A053